jgi:hypothetical protein
MRTAALTLTLIAAVGLARADDFPRRKPGLWETTMTGEANRAHEPRTSRLCTDRAFEDLMIKKGMDMMSTCEKRDVKASGNIITVKSVCQFGKSNLTSTGVWTYKGDTAYQMVSDGTFDPPMGATSKTHSVQEGKWVGACPVDMKPGDMVIMMPDGKELRTSMLKGGKG